MTTPDFVDPSTNAEPTWQRQLYQAWVAAGHPVIDAQHAQRAPTRESVTHDGRTLTVTRIYDAQSNLPDSGDWYGQLIEQRTGYPGHRPHECTGNAEVVHTGRGYRVWWQPPADVPRGTEAFDQLRDRVRGWYANEWHYIGVVVTVERVCACCQSFVEVAQPSLWGIEDDTEYWQDVVGELLDQIGDITLTETGR